MKTIKIEKVPGILVIFVVEEDLITQISLRPAKHFSCQIIGKPANLLKKQILSWLTLYSQKKSNQLTLPLKTKKQTEFQKNVSATLTSISFGKLTSYKKLAELSGYPKAQRAVGNVCGQNNFPLLIPCHRVIHSGGSIGKFAAGVIVKKRLLAFEESFSC